MGLLDQIDAQAERIMAMTAEIRREAAVIRHDQATAIETPELLGREDDDDRS